MAGDAPNYQRKTTERRDSFKQQHRKNSVGRQKDQIQRSTSSSPGGMPFPKPSSAKVSTHQSVNGFNAQEIEQHLNGNFQAVIRAYHDHSISERERPEKFSSGEQAWGGNSGVQSAWGESKACLMASGQDFLAELRKHAS